MKATGSTASTMLICGILQVLGSLFFVLLSITKKARDSRVRRQQEKEAKYASLNTKDPADYAEKEIQVHEGSLVALDNGPWEPKKSPDPRGKEIIDAVVKAVNENLDTNYNVWDLDHLNESDI